MTAEQTSSDVASGGTGARALLIGSVRTPMGFFVLVALVIEGALAPIVGFTAGAERMLTLSLMAFVFVCLVAIVTILAIYRPEALSGDRPVINVSTGPLIARMEQLEADLEKARTEAATYRSEVARLTSLRNRLWAHLDRVGGIDMLSLKRELGATANPTAEREIEAALGLLLQDGFAEPDPKSSAGHYKPSETFKARRAGTPPPSK